MNKEKAQEYIEKNLEKSENLIGFFFAVRFPKIWLFFLIGPLAALSMKNYFIAVTSRGIYFHSLNMFGKFSTSDFFEYNEIKNVKIGKGFLQKSMMFQFGNGRSLNIKAQLKGVEKVAKITEEVENYIRNNIPVIK